MQFEDHNVCEGNRENKGKDLDEKSTAQNFINVARQGDLSPRQVDKGRSNDKGRKKQQKYSTYMQRTGVQTRRTMTKSNLLP